jgi:hypothetical protein
MAYDKNWLQKAKAKAINDDLRNLTHISNDGKTTRCGKSVTGGGVLMVSLGGTPTCATCRGN